MTSAENRSFFFFKNALSFNSKIKLPCLRATAGMHGSLRFEPNQVCKVCHMSEREHPPTRWWLQKRADCFYAFLIEIIGIPHWNPHIAPGFWESFVKFLFFNLKPGESNWELLTNWLQGNIQTPKYTVSQNMSKHSFQWASNLVDMYECFLWSRFVAPKLFIVTVKLLPDLFKTSKQKQTNKQTNNIFFFKIRSHIVCYKI